MKRVWITGLTALVLIIGVAAFLPHLAAAAPKDEICQGVGAVSTGGCDAAQGNTLGDIVKLIIDVLSRVIGIVAVIMFMVGGFKYVSSGGDSSKVASAKNTLLYAAIGLVIVVFAQTIVWFILDQSTQDPSTTPKKTTKTTYIPRAASHYAIEFNNKAVL